MVAIIAQLLRIRALGDDVAAAHQAGDAHQAVVQGKIDRMPDELPRTIPIQTLFSWADGNRLGTGLGRP